MVSSSTTAYVNAHASKFVLKSVSYVTEPTNKAPMLQSEFNCSSTMNTEVKFTASHQQQSVFPEHRVQLKIALHLALGGWLILMSCCQLTPS